jgi:hypothetical protein
MNKISDRKRFILENSALFWYIPEEMKPCISDESLVETVLNFYSNLNNHCQDHNKI